MSENLPEKELWYKRWYIPTTIPILAFILFLICKYFLPAIPIEISVPIMIVSATVSLSWLIEKNRTTISEQIRKELESDFRKITSQISQPYFAYLRDDLLGQTEQALNQLVGKGRKILTVEACTEQLVLLINNLDREQQEILAVCGQKRWGSPEVTEYYKKNYEKSVSGVKIRRVFLQEEDKEGFEEGEQKVLREHLSPKYPNVEARVVYAKDLKKHFGEYKFPKGFGFAILGNTVLVHWGLGKNLPEAGRKLDNPYFVQKHRQIFNRLWAIGKGESKKEIQQIQEDFLLKSVENKQLSPQNFTKK